MLINMNKLGYLIKYDCKLCFCFQYNFDRLFCTIQWKNVSFFIYISQDCYFIRNNIHSNVYVDRTIWVCSKLQWHKMKNKIDFSSQSFSKSTYSLFTWDIVPKVVRTEDIVLDSFSAPFRKARLESADTLPRLMLFQARSVASFVFGDFSFALSPGGIFSNRSCKRWRRFREVRTICGEFRTASTSRWNVNDTLRESGRMLVADISMSWCLSPTVASLGLPGASSDILYETAPTRSKDETWRNTIVPVAGRWKPFSCEFHDRLILGMTARGENRKV